MIKRALGILRWCLARYYNFMSGKGYQYVDWYYSCGRCFLSVGGVAVVMEGDICRDPDIPEDLLHTHTIQHFNFKGQSTGTYHTERVWTRQAIKWVAGQYNEAKDGKPIDINKIQKFPK